MRKGGPHLPTHTLIGSGQQFCSFSTHPSHPQEVCRALRLMLCRKPALSYADLVDTPPSPWPSGSGRVMEVVRSRKSRPQRAGALVKVAVAAGAFDAVFSRVASHAQNGSFQEEAMMTLAVLCHSGEPVPQDEAVWVRVQEAMKLHSGRGEVITVRAAAERDKPCRATPICP